MPEATSKPTTQPNTEPTHSALDQFQTLNEIDRQLRYLRGGVRLLQNALDELEASDDAAFIIEGLDACLTKLEALQATSWEIARKEHPLDAVTDTMDKLHATVVRDNRKPEASA